MNHAKSRTLSLFASIAIGAAGLAALPSAQAASNEDFSKLPIFQGLSGQIVFYDTSGGSITKAMADGLLKNFTEATGVKVVADYNNSDTKLFAGAQSGNVPWSLAEITTKSDEKYAIEHGYLMPLDTSVIPLDRLHENSYSEYSLYGELYGMMLTWNAEHWGDKHPKNWNDFYDTQNFPGKRCLYKGAQYGWVFESALLADGVKPADLYPLDIPRALKKLDTIKKDIVWWDSGSESITLMANGECDMAIMWSGRVLDAVVNGQVPLEATWLQAGYESSVYTVPVGAPNAKAGMALLAWIAYDRAGNLIFGNGTGGPFALKSIELSDYDKNVQPFMAIGSNLDIAIEESGDYYSEHLKELTAAMTQWLTQ